MRNIDEKRYQLLYKDTGKWITEMDESQAFRELHYGAVYMHDGTAYQVVKFDQESRTAYAVLFHGNYYTAAGGETGLRIVHESRKKTFAQTMVHYGDVNVSESIYMFKKIQFHNHQNLGFEQLPKALSKNYDTESTWLLIPKNVVSVYRGLLRVNEKNGKVSNNYFEGICFALKNAARMATMTEQNDIGVTVSSNVLDIFADNREEMYVYFYDKYVGGLGFSEKIYEMTENITENAVRLVSGCKCKDGCAACIGDYRLDKQMVLWGLQNLLEHWDTPMGVKTAVYAPSVFRKKEFQFENFERQWQELCQRMSENGEDYAAFLKTVPSVQTDGDRLILKVTHSFFADWVMEPGNRTGLVNMIKEYADTPAGFFVCVESDGAAPDKETMDKMWRRMNGRY